MATPTPTTYLGQRFADFGNGWPAAERAAAQAERIAAHGFTRGTTTEDLRRELRRRMGA